MKYGLMIIALLAPIAAWGRDDKPVAEAELRTDIAALASDDFQGRAPGTDGETKTLNFIAQAWHRAGLIGAATPQGGWFQPVPLLERKTVRDQLRVIIAGRELVVTQDDFAVRSNTAHIDTGMLPIRFGGYGVDANGRAIGNVHGAIVVIVENDPPSHDPPVSLSMAARTEIVQQAGAAAVLVLGNDTTVIPILRPRFARGTTTGGDAPDLWINGGISPALWDRMMRAANVPTDRSSGHAAAMLTDAIDIGVTARLTVQSAIRRFNSYNVVAKLPGRRPDGQSVLLSGHWDHLGNDCAPPDKADRICNGAVDNASGIAVLNAVARRLGAGRNRIDRDIWFVATTAEEKGLLGAHSFVARPPLPISNIMLNLNIDTVAIAPRGAPVAIIGRGTTPFDADVDRVARQIKRRVDTDQEANEFIRRQDGWAFGKVGVPAIMVGGSFSDQERLIDFLSGPYHSPDDELTDNSELGGAADDADLHVALVRYFGRKSYKQP